MEKDYINLNRQVYDELAEEFESKIGVRTENNLHIIENFTAFLKERSAFPNCKVLELGPGAGHLCKILSEAGVDMTALEFSPKMAEVCKKVSPLTNVMVGEFSEYDFGKQKYDGILAVAFIHLFPSSVALTVLEKMGNLLKPGGIIYIGTTLNDRSSEGLYPKTNFKKPLMRFRRKFTRDEFENMLTGSNLKIIQAMDYIDNEEEGKIWMDYIVTQI